MVSLREPELRVALAGGLLGATCMTVGGFVYARMPTIPPVIRLLPLASIRASTSARPWGAGLCFVGVLILTLAWLALGLAVRRRRADVSRVARTVLLWTVPLFVAPPLLSGDGWSYAAFGYLAGQGRSPYVATPSVLHGAIVDGVCECWRNTPAPYGPLPLLWGGAFSKITSSPWLLMESYRLLALIGLVLLLYAVPRLARFAGRQPASALWLAASPFVLAHGIGGAHLDLLMVGLMATSLLLVLVLVGHRRWVIGAIGVGLATAVKAPAVVAGLGVALLALPARATWTARSRMGALVGAVAVSVPVAIGVLTGLGVGWIHTATVPLVLHTPLSVTYDVGQWASELSGRNAAPAVDVLGVLALGLACAAILLRARTGDPPAGLTAVAAAMLLTTVLSPVTNYWYFLWCLPLLACCRLPAWAARCVTTLVLTLGLIAPLNSSLRLSYTGNLVLTLVIGAVLIALVAPVGREFLRRELAASDR